MPSGVGVRVPPVAPSFRACGGTVYALSSNLSFWGFESLQAHHGRADIGESSWLLTSAASVRTGECSIHSSSALTLTESPLHTKESRSRAWEKIKEKRSNWLAENGPCSKCGSDLRLQIHHVDPKKKESHNIWSWSDERRAIELEKCIVLCMKCHQEIHTPKLVHGTGTGYSRGCRCQPCKSAKTELTKQWRIKMWGSNASKPRSTN